MTNKTIRTVLVIGTFLSQLYSRALLAFLSCKLQGSNQGFPDITPFQLTHPSARAYAGGVSKKTLIETVGIVKPGRQDYVAVSIPAFNQPDAMYTIPIADIPVEVLAPMMKHGTQLLARITFFTEEDTGRLEVECITGLELVPAS